MRPPLVKAPLSLQENLILGFARLGFAGLSPVMPGTCGSLLAVLVAPFIFMPLGFWWRLGFLAVIMVAGTKVCTKAEDILKKTDPGEVVIDELLGQWLTFLPFTGLSFWEYVAGFVLFRIFDIAKPWPVRNFERLPKGLGIMADDAAAGIWAMVCLGIVYGLVN